MNESIKQLITCKWCQSIVDEPVLLPCSETVCRKHTVEISETKCKFCNNVHVLRESEQFPTNKVVQDLFHLKIKELNFGLKYKKASERMADLTTLLNDYNTLKEHPDEYITEHFSKERNNVDLAREKLIIDINQISDRLISEIDSKEKESAANLLKYNLSSFIDDSESIKVDLSKWEQNMKYLVVNYKLWKKINTKCSRYVAQLKRSRLEIEEKLIGKPCKLKTESYFVDMFINQLTT
jgi:hypothetical protein